MWRRSRRVLADLYESVSGQGKGLQPLPVPPRAFPSFKRHFAGAAPPSRSARGAVSRPRHAPPPTLAELKGARTPPPPPPPELTPEQLRVRHGLVTGVLLAVAAGGYWTARSRRDPLLSAREEEVLNWSGTHAAASRRFYEPSSEAELEALVKDAHAVGQPLRPLGSSLSPNGLGLRSAGMVSTRLLDEVLWLDEERGVLCAQAGARVAQVAAWLKTRGWTLPNFASVREQTLGGFTQAGSHGTGAALPPLDACVRALELVTPARGRMRLSREEQPALFALARLGLGSLGVVARLELALAPAHRLVERTCVETRAQVRSRHAQRLRSHRHLRYMWFPHCDAVVVVAADVEEKAGGGSAGQGLEKGPSASSSAPGKQSAPGKGRARPLASLLQLAREKRLDASAWDGVGGSASMPDLRALLLMQAPLDAAWVARVNAAEVEYWRAQPSERRGWSDEILGFDAGGEQWVSERALGTGTLDNPSGADMRYVQELLALVERRRIPAPGPIEQRWSAGSASPMSPARGPPESVHSWVGIIMYAPSEGGEGGGTRGGAEESTGRGGNAGGEEEKTSQSVATKTLPTGVRGEVQQAFERYALLVDRELSERYGALSHWAKLELPDDPQDRERVRRLIASRLPVRTFQRYRADLDPKNILGSPEIDTLLGSGEPPLVEPN